jgi:hypothetical protein
LASLRDTSKEGDVPKNLNAEHDPGEHDKNLNQDSLTLVKVEFMFPSILSVVPGMPGVLGPHLAGDEANRNGVDHEDSQKNNVDYGTTTVLVSGKERFAVAEVGQNRPDGESQQEPVNDGEGLQVLEQLLGNVQSSLSVLLVIGIKDGSGQETNRNVDDHREGENQKGKKDKGGVHFIGGQENRRSQAL